MSNSRSATAIASPNIAFIKYWGNRDQNLRIPANGSISMTLGGLETRTTVTFDARLAEDLFLLDGTRTTDAALLRVSHHLDLIRELAGLKLHARVESRNNFPVASGVASSASAFAALTLAACAAAGLDLHARMLSRLARRGSGSASRSIFGGFVECVAGQDDQTSFSQQLAPPEHWELVDLVAVVTREKKPVSSTAGHALADTSPLQAARVADAPRRLQICRDAILTRNFPRLASIAELDSNMMHAVMLTSTPPLAYWNPETVQVMKQVVAWRASGLPVFYTVDAGPNVHCITLAEHAAEISRRLRSIAGILDVLRAPPGDGARLA